MAIKLNVKSVNIIWHVLPFQLRRHAVLGASGAELLAMWVSWRIEGKAKM